MTSKLMHFINRSAIAVLVSGLVALPVFAHHSFSGYDMKKTETAQATIKEFRWGAPHSMGVFTVKGPKGELQEITAATAAPAMFLKQGFKPRDFKVGDKVEISWHPTRGGSLGGHLSSIKFSDGRIFKEQEILAIGNLEATEAAEREKAQ
jgi:hypothetical protein